MNSILECHIFFLYERVFFELIQFILQVSFLAVILFGFCTFSILWMFLKEKSVYDVFSNMICKHSKYGLREEVESELQKQRQFAPQNCTSSFH